MGVRCANCGYSVEWVPKVGWRHFVISLTCTDPEPEEH